MDKLVLYKADDGGWRWRERIITDEGQEVWQDAPVLRVELVFDGTPAEFGVNAQAIERQLGMGHTRNLQLPLIYVCVPDERDKKPEANRIVVCFQDSLGPDVPIGYVVAEVLPDGKSWLSTFAGEDHWPRVAECWQLVRAEMERRGWQFYAPSDRDLGKRWKEPGDQSEEGTLVKHKTFFLDTSADYFVTWLRDYTRAAPYRDFPTEKGRINLQSAQPAYRPAGPTEMVMDGFYIAPSGDDSERGTHLHRLISFKIVPLGHGRTEVIAECRQPVVMDYFQELLREIGRRWPESGLISGQTHSQAPASKPTPSEASAGRKQADGVIPTKSGLGKPGHPGLSHNELIYRLAKAQEAVEIKRADKDKKWKEIIKEIEWNRGGTFDSGIKLLQDARHRLHRLEKSDPDNLLEEVTQFRKEKKKN